MSYIFPPFTKMFGAEDKHIITFFKTKQTLSKKDF